MVSFIVQPQQALPHRRGHAVRKRPAVIEIIARTMKEHGAPMFPTLRFAYLKTFPGTSLYTIPMSIGSWQMLD
jgi:hypothetical protein